MRAGSSVPDAEVLLSAKSVEEKWIPHMENTTTKHAHFSVKTAGLTAVSAIPSFGVRSIEYKDTDMAGPKMRAGRAMRN